MKRIMIPAVVAGTALSVVLGVNVTEAQRSDQTPLAAVKAAVAPVVAASAPTAKPVPPGEYLGLLHACIAREGASQGVKVERTPEGGYVVAGPPGSFDLQDRLKATCDQELGVDMKKHP